MIILCLVIEYEEALPGPGGTSRNANNRKITSSDLKVRSIHQPLHLEEI